MIKNRDKLYIHTRQYVNKSAALSGDNSTFISYRANVAEACGIYGDCVKTRLPARRAAPRLRFARAPSRAGALSLYGKGGDSPKLRQIRERAGNSAKAPPLAAPPPNRAASMRLREGAQTRGARKKAGRSARPACVDTLSAVSLYAPAEVTSILGSHVERPGNMMTNTSTMNIEVRKYGM